MSDFQVEWRGTQQILNNMQEYQRRVLFAVNQVALYWSAVFETYAKQNAPWTDQTGNARSALHGFIEELSGDMVAIYLSHGVDYGVMLETKYAGRFQIIWPTIQQHIPAIQQMLQGIFG